MSLEKRRLRHGWMTPPAEESDIRPEQDISGPVFCRIRLYGMAEETHRSPVYIPYVAAVVQHDVRIDVRVRALRMTPKAELPQIQIRTFPQ
jgi:hypothetical protein